MHRRLRIDVAERQAAVVLVDDGRRDLAVDDLLEEIVLHHGAVLWYGVRITAALAGINPPSFRSASACPGIVGIDEAGYGPNLGPFVMTAVALPEPHDADPWDVFRAAVRRRDGEADDGRPLVADSKVVHAGDNLRALEPGVRSLLGPFPAEAVISLATLLRGYCPAAIGGIEGGVVRRRHGPARRGAADVLAAAARSFAAACSKRGDSGAACAQRHHLQPAFNDILDRWGSKGAVLGEGLSELLAWDPGPDDGGRCATSSTSTAAAISTPRCCNRPAGRHGRRRGGGPRPQRYRVLGLKRQMRLTFQPRADGEHFCVALASMVSKYLREVLMSEFNRFWLAKVPGLNRRPAIRATPSASTTPSSPWPADEDRRAGAVAKPVTKRCALARSSV